MISINTQSCELCGTCVGVCPVDALIVGRNELTVKSDICIDCSVCVYVCPIDALSEETHEV